MKVSQELKDRYDTLYNATIQSRSKDVPSTFAYTWRWAREVLEESFGPGGYTARQNFEFPDPTFVVTQEFSIQMIWESRRWYLCIDCLKDNAGVGKCYIYIRNSETGEESSGWWNKLSTKLAEVLVEMQDDFTTPDEENKTTTWAV